MKNFSSKELSLVLFFFIQPLIVFGSGGTEKSRLNWDTPSEYLEYHSCGCADSCWVAELKKKINKKVIRRLRCDCEKMFILNGPNQKELVYSDDCKEFECSEVNCRSQLISKKMKQLSKESSK